jgi:hypothetical protein
MMTPLTYRCGLGADEGADKVQKAPDSHRVISLTEDRIASLERELEFHREQARRHDALMLSMAEVMKAISPPGHEEPRESPAEATEQPGKVEAQAPIEERQEPSERQASPWWRRWFGG